MPSVQVLFKQKLDRLFTTWPAPCILISAQGNIAFTKEADLGTRNAWVWPFGAGLRIHF